jgi:PAS domain S-box-containing protein
MKHHKRQMPRILADRLAALSRVGTALMRQVDEAAVLRLCAQTARELTAAAFAAVILRPVTEEHEEAEPLVPSEGARFQLAVVVGATQEQEAFLRRVLLTGEELFALLFHQGMPARVADVVPLFSPAEEPPSADGQDATDPTASALGPAEERAKGLPPGHAVVRSFLGAPLLDATGQVRGGVLLGHSESGQFRQEDELLLMNLASQTALALERARLARLMELRDRQLPAVLDRRADGVPLLDIHGSLVRENGAARQVRERLQDTSEGEQAVAVRLQEAERRARERVGQLEAIFEAVPDGVLVYDSGGMIVQMNTAARRLLGLDVVPDYVTRPWAERLARFAMRDRQGHILSSEQWPLVRLLNGEVLTGPNTREVLLQPLDGGEIQASIAGTPLRDQDGRVTGAVMTVRDLSERYRLEQRLEKAEHEARERASQLEAIFEAMPEALLVYDREGRLTRMNTAGQQLYERFGLSESAAAPFAKRVAQLTVWDDHGQPLARESFPNARILAGEVLSPAQPMEITQLDRQGERVCLRVTGGPLRDPQGHLVGAVTICRDITERNRAERTLRQQAQQLQLQAELIDRAHDAILVRDPHSRILSWNRGAQHLYGWTAQETLGRVTHELLQTSFPVSLADVEAHLEREGQWEGELRHRCRDGSEVLVESRHVLFRDAGGRPTAILEINRDITQRRRLEALQRQLQAATQAQLALLQLVLDELPSSVYLVQGSNARLVLANRTATTVWGAAWAHNQPMSEFLKENDIRILGLDGKALPPEQRATWRALHEGQAVYQYQEIIGRPDGQTLPMLVNAIPLTLSPLLLGLEDASLLATEGSEPVALVVYQDVTALKEVERLKDEFIGIATHELRAPLTVLNSAVQTLHFQQQQGRGMPLDEWQREALATIEEATQQMVALSAALLDITRLQGGRLQMHPEPVDLVALSRRVIKRLQRTTQRHRLSLHTSQERLIIALDAGRMEQVLTNLLSNAIKYNPHGGPIEVSVWAEREVREVVLSIRDEGIGIPAQQQATIFGRFVRATNARTIAGTGLGLYLCRSLVELHGGRLWFESIEGRGSTFFMALPTEREVSG